MNKSKNKTKRSNQISNAIKIFPVPFSFNTVKENLIINTNVTSKKEEELIIIQAFKFHSQGNIQQAAKYYQSFIDQGFKDYRVFSNYGSILKSLGKLEEAEISYRKAIELNPNFADAHYNLGNALSDLGKLQEAELSTRKAIELNPNFADAHLNLGNILYSSEKLKEAELSTRKAIEIHPDFAGAYLNLGSILINRGKLNEAEIYMRKAIEIQPDFADAYSNLSFIELLKGDYHSGLENYEFRFKKKKPATMHGKPTSKRIDNTKLKHGEKLVVVSEQGLGDTLQYMRYIPYLRNQGLDISFYAQETLHTLIKASAVHPNPLPPAQANKVTNSQWIPLASLPRYLGVNPKNPIISEPYIFSTKELIKNWKSILSKDKKPIIGINWQGNPNVEKSNLKGRSLPLETFSTLAKNHDCQFLSLQKKFGAEQLNDCSFKNKFVACQSQINSTWDFLEIAGIIANCDLIITSDTSIAHLAGGMGKSTWLLLKYVPGWIWGLQGEYTFWYPSMRLFRQQEKDNWLEVMQRVSDTLKAEIGDK